MVDILNALRKGTLVSPKVSYKNKTSKLFFYLGTNYPLYLKGQAIELIVIRGNYKRVQGPERPSGKN
jgi:hypothetical protein